MPPVALTKIAALTKQHPDFSFGIDEGVVMFFAGDYWFAEGTLDKRNRVSNITFKGFVAPATIALTSILDGGFM